LAGWDFFMLFPLHKNAYFLHEKMFGKSWGKSLVEWGKFAIFVCFSHRHSLMWLMAWELAIA
jgi:hypothetical protein